MSHLILDLAKIGLIVIAAAIAISAFIGTSGMNYDPFADENYVPFDDEDDDI